MANNTEIKSLIVKREQLKTERDKLGIDLEKLMGNPMGALSKLADLGKAGELSKEIESLSDQITNWAVVQINEQDQKVLANG